MLTLITFIMHNLANINSVKSMVALHEKWGMTLELMKGTQSPKNINFAVLYLNGKTEEAHIITRTRI